MSDPNELEKFEAENEEPCEHCGEGDPVPAKGYWRCPVCDAEWNDKDEDS